MAVATQVTTLEDLRTDFLYRVREATGVTATNDAADRAINVALHDLHISPGNYVPWAIRRAVLNTHALYNTGTVAVTTSARTAVVGTDTLWDTAVTGMGFNNARAGGKMTLAGTTDVHEVSSVTDDTNIVLVNRWIADTALSGDNYTYFEDEYALASDFFRPVDARSFSIEWGIPFIGEKEFRRNYPNNYVTGRPRVATVIQLAFNTTDATTPRYRVVLNPPPDKVYKIPYSYITSNLAVTSAGVEQAQLTNTDDEPIVPLRYRHAIVFHALYHWYRDRKDDPRSQEAKGEYIDIIRRVQGEVIEGQDRPRFAPQSYFARKGNRLNRPRYSTGEEFETLKI
tara:strand:- start:5387 stop:6409 length:1023 start_codon:yes stop_codon:yes gene_type:complete